MYPANPFAYLVILSCVPVAIYLFSKYPAAKAASLVIVGSAMFLPEHVEFDLPLIPPLDKSSIPAIGALIGAYIFRGEMIRRARAFRGVDTLIVVMLVANIFTIFNNLDPVVWSNGEVLPALEAYDVISATIRDLLATYAAFFVGRSMFTTRRDLYGFASFMVACGVVYSVLVLIEIRLSPQLHNWIYGFHPANFAMSIRFGGYRPTVFMSHGLTTARFMLGTLLCAAALGRANEKVWKISSKAWALYLGVVLALSNSAGAWVLGAVAGPIVLFTSAKNQMRFAALLGALVILYPVLRSSGAIPVDDIIKWSTENIGQDRADSLQDRFEQEDALLTKVNERRLFGWGSGGRYNIYHARFGGNMVIDGEWMHVFGRRGWVGFVCVFGLMLSPLWIALRTFRQLRPRDASLVSGLIVMTLIWTVDLIPNSSGTVPQLFVVGVLYGGIRGLGLQTAQERMARREALRTRLRKQAPPPEADEAEPAEA